MMLKLVVLLVVISGGAIAEHDDAGQLSVHMASIVEQMTRLMDEFQVRMNSMEEMMAGIQGRINRLEEKMGCHHYFASITKTSGLYLVLNTGELMTHECNFIIETTEGWTVIQRRINDNVKFSQDWEDYKTGFGDPQGSMWLGLDNIHNLCSKNCELNISMAKDPSVDSVYAHYSNFSIADESDKYRLTVGGYRGTAGDSLADESEYGMHNGMQFSTYDDDNDNAHYNCAKSYHGGFWYDKCLQANPNGRYFKGKSPHKKWTGIMWWNYTSNVESLKYIEMRVKPTV